MISNPPVATPGRPAGEPSAWARRLPLLALATFGAVAGVMKIRTVDFFWHLAAGRWILDHRALPRTDPFRFSHDGVEWVDHEWGFQLILGLIEKVGGLTGLVLARALLFLGLGLLSYWGIRRRSRPAPPGALVALVCLVMLFGLRGRFYLRPELATLLAMVVLLLLLDRLRERQDLTAVFSLFALSSLWANLHPGVLAAPILAGAYLLGDRFLARRMLGRESHPIPLWQVLATPVGMALAILANPWGFEVFLVPARISAALAGLPATNPDWAPVWEKPQPLLFVGLSMLLVLAGYTWTRTRRLDPALLLVVAALLPLVASSVRHQGLLWIAGAWLAGDCLARLQQARETDPGWDEARTAGAVALLALSATLLCCLPDELIRWRPGHEFGFGVAEGLYPEGAIEELARWEPVGSLYNSPAFGGYLLWRLYPPRQIFIDTRNEVDPALLRTLAAARASETAWRALLGRHEIDAALVRFDDRPRPVYSANPGAGPAPAIEYRTASAMLFPQEGFALVWWDESAMLFLRRRPERTAELERRAYTFVQPEDWRHVLSRAAREPEYLEGLRRELRRKLAETPSDRRARALLTASQAIADGEFTVGLPTN